MKLDGIDCPEGGAKRRKKKKKKGESGDGIGEWVNEEALHEPAALNKRVLSTRHMPSQPPGDCPPPHAPRCTRGGAERSRSPCSQTPGPGRPGTVTSAVGVEPRALTPPPRLFSGWQHPGANAAGNLDAASAPAPAPTPPWHRQRLSAPRAATSARHEPPSRSRAGPTVE